MQYDLPSMAKAKNRRRRPRPIKVRGAPLRFERELESILNEVVSFWVRAYRAPEMVTDAEAAELREVDDEALLVLLLAKIRDWVRRLAGWMRDMWIQRIKQVADIDVGSLASSPVDAADVAATREWLEELVEDLSRQTKHRVTSAMADATLRQLPAVQAREVVGEAVQKARTRAKSIAGDMTGKMHGKMNEALQLEARVTRYKWNHSFRPNPRRHHVERQGNIYEWAKPPSDGHPGYAYHCRCTAEPVV